MKVRGLVLSYGYCEEMKKGYDLWHIDPDVSFHSPWEAIRSLAEFFYLIWKGDVEDSEADCCKGAQTRLNKDVYTEAILDENGIDPEGLVGYCPVCHSFIWREGGYNYLELAAWLETDYGVSPGDGDVHFGEFYVEDADSWNRDEALESLLKYPKSWFVLGDSSEKILALAVPEELLPEESLKEHREEFEFGLRLFEKPVFEAYKEWRDKKSGMSFCPCHPPTGEKRTCALHAYLLADESCECNCSGAD